jgi:hypothetical protein
VACGDEDSDEPDVADQADAGDDMDAGADNNGEAPNRSGLGQGAWVIEGYSYQAHVQGDVVDLYEVSPLACIHVESFTYQAFLPTLFRDISWDGDVLVGLVRGGLTQHRLAPIEQLDPLCADGGTPTKGDPGYQLDMQFTFDVMWETFEEHYPFFALRGEHWEEAGQEARARIGRGLTEGELFWVIADVLETLQDGHVSLSSPVADFDGDKMPFQVLLEQEYEEQGEVYFDDFLVRELVAYLVAAEPLMAEPMRGQLGEVQWAHVDQDIGYLRMIDFEPEDEQERVALFEAALAELSDTETLVVDLRLNFGGEDSLSLDMLSRLATEVTPALRKAAFYQGTYLEEQSVSIEPLPEGPLYQGDVVILVSANTVSAAEVFTLAARELPSVTVVGQPTNGIFSDIFERTLPNGWKLGLSKERYLSPGGENFEAVGIPPDVALEAQVFAREDREAGLDASLQEAIEVVRGL